MGKLGINPLWNYWRIFNKKTNQITFFQLFSEGTRMDNTEKNIGIRTYAFSTLQLTTFPYQYRAPVGSYQSKYTKLS